MTRCVLCSRRDLLGTTKKLVEVCACDIVSSPVFMLEVGLTTDADESGLNSDLSFAAGGRFDVVLDPDV